MLTGDKKETALKVGILSGLIENTYDILDLELSDDVNQEGVIDAIN